MDSNIILVICRVREAREGSAARREELKWAVQWEEGSWRVEAILIIVLLRRARSVSRSARYSEIGHLLVIWICLLTLLINFSLYFR